MKAVTFPDEAFLCFLACGDQFHIAECLKHFHHFGIRQYSGVGTAFKYKFPVGKAVNLTAGTVFFLEYDDIKILLFQKKCGRESGQSGTDNYYLSLLFML